MGFFRRWYWWLFVLPLAACFGGSGTIISPDVDIPRQGIFFLFEPANQAIHAVPNKCSDTVDDWLNNFDTVENPLVAGAYYARELADGWWCIYTDALEQADEMLDPWAIEVFIDGNIFVPEGGVVAARPL